MLPLRCEMGRAMCSSAHGQDCHSASWHSFFPQVAPGKGKLKKLEKSGQIPPGMSTEEFIRTSKEEVFICFFNVPFMHALQHTCGDTCSFVGLHTAI